MAPLWFQGGRRSAVPPSRAPVVSASAPRDDAHRPPPNIPLSLQRQKREAIAVTRYVALPAPAPAKLAAAARKLRAMKDTRLPSEMLRPTLPPSATSCPLPLPRTPAHPSETSSGTPHLPDAAPRPDEPLVKQDGKADTDVDDAAPPEGLGVGDLDAEPRERLDAEAPANQDDTHPVYHGMTELMSACDQGLVSAARSLIAAGADPNSENDLGVTALMLACEKGFEAVARSLLRAGAAVDQADVDGWTALLLSSQGGHQAVARMLLDWGADPNLANDEGATALMFARQNNQQALIDSLLEGGGSLSLSAQGGAVA